MALNGFGKLVADAAFDSGGIVHDQDSGTSRIITFVELLAKFHKGGRTS